MSNQPCCGGPETRAQHTIESSRRSAPLQMPENYDASFFTGQIGYFRRDALRNSTQTLFASGLLSPTMGDSAADRKSSLGSHDDAEALTGVLSAPDRLADFFDIVRNFGNQNDVGSPGNAGVQRYPARMASHDFHHEHASV